jgi:hypothetical protein
VCDLARCSGGRSPLGDASGPCEAGRLRGSGCWEPAPSWDVLADAAEPAAVARACGRDCADEAAQVLVALWGSAAVALGDGPGVFPKLVADLDLGLAAYLLTDARAGRAEAKVYAPDVPLPGCTAVDQVLAVPAMPARQAIADHFSRKAGVALSVGKAWA